MNILQIVSSSRLSGAEKHVLVLSERLRQRGHQVTTVCPPGGWLPDQLRASGIPTLELPMHGSRVGATALGLLRYVRENRIDLIHTHLTSATYFGCLVAHRTHRPLVSSVHVRTHDLVYRKFFPKQRARIVTVSDFLREMLREEGIPAARIQTIYNGTDFCPGPDDDDSTWETDLAANSPPVRAELSVPQDASLVGLFARVGEFKGHFVLARAMQPVIAAHPQTYFVCVGPVEPEMQRSLCEIAAEAGVADRLRFTGTRDDVRRLMSAMDVVTLPSRYEACSMAIIEAMALGKPVVATRAGGNPELVQEPETGLLIERTPESLFAGLSCLLSDAQRRTRMGQAARLRARRRFSADVMAQNLDTLYQELIEMT